MVETSAQDGRMVEVDLEDAIFDLGELVVVEKVDPTQR